MSNREMSSNDFQELCVSIDRRYSSTEYPNFSFFEAVVISHFLGWYCSGSGYEYTQADISRACFAVWEFDHEGK